MAAELCLPSRVAESAEKQDHEQDDEYPSPDWHAEPPQSFPVPLTTPRKSWSNAWREKLGLVFEARQRGAHRHPANHSAA
jgi:hypothetical protein